MALPNPTYINKFITDGHKQTMCIKNFYDTTLTNSISNPDHICRISIGDFFINHRKELESIAEVKKVDESYFYKPKMFSYDLYGTTELWLALLRVNNMKNVTDFHMPYIIAYNPDGLDRLISIFFKREK